MRTPEEVRMLAHAALAQVSGADEAEALVFAQVSALTRFANNRIHQNVASEDLAVSVRAVVGKRVGVASTNHVNEAGLAAVCAAAVEAARTSRQDPEFPGLPAGGPVEHPSRAHASTRLFGPHERGEAVRAIIKQSSRRGCTAAGTVAVNDAVVAVANTVGADAVLPTTACNATVLSTGPDSGSGWASFFSTDASLLAPDALGDRAATLALRTAGPRALDPGSYTVVLSPEAVADIVRFLGWYGMSAKAVEEGRSFMTGHMGERVLSSLLTIRDDALDATASGLTFDYEGVPKTPLTLIDAGVATAAVTDSYWAAKAGRPNTGHALPAPNSMGPLPLDLVMSPGDSSVEEMIASVERGVYVTRFHYVNIEDPVRATLTGMTRDGTLMIEGGRLTYPVRNLRFTQSAVDALAAVRAVGADVVALGEDDGMSVRVPALALDSFAFTGQTS
jgi:PmbA protein